MSHLFPHSFIGTLNETDLLSFDFQCKRKWQLVLLVLTELVTYY